MNKNIKISILDSRQGVTTVTAVFMLLLMFMILTGLIAAFFNYGLSIQTQMNIEQERSKENIVLSRQINVETNQLLSVTINNTGTIEVTVRGLYLTEPDGQVTFIDPTDLIDICISPTQHRTISASALSTRPLLANTIIEASTERGTKTVDIPLPTPTPTPTNGGNSDENAYGPLMLKFSEFKYRDLKDPSGRWYDGWMVPSGITCEWKLSVTNVGVKSLTVTSVSSLSTVADGSSARKVWFMQAGSPIQLAVDATVPIVYSSPTEKFYTGSVDSCMVFLTFFGQFDAYTDEKGVSHPSVPYAQTIPFEAVTVT